MQSHLILRSIFQRKCQLLHLSFSDTRNGESEKEEASAGVMQTFSLILNKEETKAFPRQRDGLKTPKSCSEKVILALNWVLQTQNPDSFGGVKGDVDSVAAEVKVEVAAEVHNEARWRDYM